MTLLIAAQILSALLGTLGLWCADGWPVTHEQRSTAARVLQFADAWRAGDWLPLWSTAENCGLGSPMPLYYPRLFTTTAMGFLLCGADVKTALVIATVLFGVLGGLGLYLCCRVLRLPRVHSGMLSLVFIHLHYAQTDVMVRGAMAEFAAMALIPLLAAWSLRVMLHGEAGRWGAAVGIGLFFAHPAIFAAAMLLPLGALCAAFILHPARRKGLLAEAALGGCAGAAVAAPWAILWNAQRDHFLFDVGYLMLQNPGNFFVAPSEFLINFLTDRHAGNSVDPQLDTGFLLGFALLATLSLVALRRSPRQRRRWRRRLPGLILVAGCLAAYFLFMNRVTWPLYQRSTLLWSLQFPWRLLAPASVLLVVLYAMLLRLLRGVVAPRLFTLLILLPLTIAAAVSCRGQLSPGSRLSSDELASADPVNWIEYAPLPPRFRGDHEPMKWMRLVLGWLDHYAHLPPIVRGQVRSVSITSTPGRRGWIIRSSADKPFTVELPMAWSDLVLIAPVDRSFRLPSWRTRDNPRLCFAVPAGKREIRVDAPSWFTVWERNRLKALSADAIPR